MTYNIENTIITDTISGDVYTIDSFEDAIDSLYEGHEDCIEAAREMICKLRSREYAGDEAAFLAVVYK